MVIGRKLLSDVLWLLAFLIGLPAQESDIDPVYRTLADLCADGGSVSVALIDARGPIQVAAVGRAADALVPLGSARKWLTSAVVLMLVEEGKLSLDAPIADVLTRWQSPYRDQITLRHLMSHTSGLVRRPPPGRCSGAQTLAACVDQIAVLPLLSLPGERFRYSSAGFNVVARVAEEASGMRWQDLMQQRLFSPLGMRQTTLLPAGPGLPEMVGEIWSTPEDFARFLLSLLRCGSPGALLSCASVAEMERSQTGSIPRSALVGMGTEASDYGLGVWRGAVDEGGRAMLVSAHGKGGFLAWIDRREGTAGALSLRGQSEAALRGRAAVALMKQLGR